MAAGFRSVVALPLRLREQTIGGLNMFHNGADPLAPGDLRLAQAFADVATIGILQRRSLHRSAMLAEQLQYALNSRIVIEHAKGVLSERNSVDMEAAFNALRRHARITIASSASWLSTSCAAGSTLRAWQRLCLQTCNRLSLISFMVNSCHAGVIQRAWVCPDLAPLAASAHET